MPTIPLEYNECNLVVREGRGKREEAEQVLEIVISPPISAGLASVV